jgi:hypothetical protein
MARNSICLYESKTFKAMKAKLKVGGRIEMENKGTVIFKWHNERQLQFSVTVTEITHSKSPNVMKQTLWLCTFFIGISNFVLLG